MLCLVCHAALYLAGLFIVYKVLDYLYRLPRLSDLGRRYILVTGCDTGFGNAITKKLDRMGCHVFAACLTEKGETELRKVCSDRLETFNMDVSRPESIRKAFQHVKSKLPSGQGLQGLLNNAGIAGKIGPAEWLTLEDYRDVFAVNLLGLVDTTTTFMPLLKLGRGRIVNTASILGRFSIPTSAPYCISKYGVESFSDCIRREMHDFGVSVHIIEPGFHKTNITSPEVLRKRMMESWEQVSDDVKADYGEAYIEQACQATVEKFIERVLTPDITGVVNAYAHALTARFPRARYMIGADAKIFFWPMSYMPEWFCDWVLRNAIKDRPIPAKALK